MKRILFSILVLILVPFATNAPAIAATVGWEKVTTLAAVEDPVAPRMRAGSMAGGWR